MNKPQIINVQMSNGSGVLGGVVGSPQPPSLVVSGLGFLPGLILIFYGPNMEPQVIREPGFGTKNTLQITKTGANAVVNVPVPVPGTPVNNIWSVIAFVPDAGDGGYLGSDVFEFPVGKS